MHDLEPRPESSRLSGRSSKTSLLYPPEGLKPSGGGSRFSRKSLIFKSF